MVKNSLEMIACKIRENYKNLGVPEINKTNVVSPLFPGQFNYCLDEVNLLRKYGDLVHIGEEHFQKIQPAIRLSDYYEQGTNGDHLAQFTIATTTGFRSPISDKGQEEYNLSVNGFISHLDSLGLDKKNLIVTYFSGNYARDIEASGKRDVLEQDLKVRVDKYMPEDSLAIPIWTDNGLERNQLIGNNTRDNFLTSAWYVSLAPWGYRNEIFYQMPNGRKLDIATIERLTYYPDIEMRKDSQGRLLPYVTNIHDWDIGAIVDGFGLERNLLAIEGKDRIYDIDLFSPFNRSKIKNEEIEALRVLHRIFTDSSWGNLSRQRKEKTRKLMKQACELDMGAVTEVLEINSDIYSHLFPDLKNGINNTIESINGYRSRIKH